MSSISSAEALTQIHPVGTHPIGPAGGSKIGFGAWAIGGAYAHGWGETDDATSVRAIRAGLEAGATWIDTAAVYGFGRSEEVVGRAVATCRDQVFICTKGGLLQGEGYGLIRDLRPQTIIAEVERSLRRLRVERIDLYQCHWPDPATPIEETWACCAKLVEQGKIGHLGLSNHGAEDIAKAHALHPVYAVQSPYNLLRRDPEVELIPFCRKAGIQFLAYSPMQSGLLSGRFRIEALAPDDWRRRKPQWYQEPNLGIYLGLVERLEALAQARGASVGQLAVAWCLREGGADAAIVGARTPEQARQNQRSEQIRLNEAEVRLIDQYAAEAASLVAGGAHV